MRIRIRSAVLCAFSLALAACHGGSGSSALPSIGSGAALTPQGSGTGTASFTVSVPASGTAQAVPQSVVITLAQGNGKMAPLTMNLRATTNGCKTMIGGGLTCVAGVTAPVGADEFVISTYAGPNGTGTRITTAQAKASVQPFNKNACTPTRSDIASLQRAG